MLLVSVCAACRVPVEYSVLLMGDSLMAGSLTPTTRELLMSDDVGFLPVVSAIGGSALCREANGAGYWLARAPEILQRHPIDGVALSLGTNDVLFRDQPVAVMAEQMQACAERLIQAYGAGRTIIWILPHARGGVADPDMEAAAGAIRRAAAAHPQVRLVDFEQYARDHGQALADLLLADGVHLTEQGNALWAQMVLEAVVADARQRGLAPAG